MDSLLAQTRGLLRQYGLRARKGLGQHFLIDEQVLEVITGAAGLTPADVVIEVGPGLGVLTRKLAGQAGWVVTVELDNKLAAVLSRTMAAFSNVTVINDSILNLDPADLLRRLGLPEAIDSYKMVANLPYYITAPVLRHFLEASFRPQTMTVMVQKEVAEAIVARPGKMSLLANSIQFYGDAMIIGQVPVGSFYPAPEVDSAILQVSTYPQPAVAVSDERGFFTMVRAGFSASRKQIVNSLAHGLGLPKDKVLSLLEKAGIAPQRRAETLTLDEWARLWKGYARAGRPEC